MRSTEVSRAVPVLLSLAAAVFSPSCSDPIAEAIEHKDFVKLEPLVPRLDVSLAQFSNEQIRDFNTCFHHAVIDLVTVAPDLAKLALSGRVQFTVLGDEPVPPSVMQDLVTDEGERLTVNIPHLPLTSGAIRLDIRIQDQELVYSNISFSSDQLTSSSAAIFSVVSALDSVSTAISKSKTDEFSMVFTNIDGPVNVDSAIEILDDVIDTWTKEGRSSVDVTVLQAKVVALRKS